MPFVSVIIPTRDRPRDLDRALESLAAVEYPAWELIVVDQGASGGSAPAVAGRISNVTVRHLMVAPRGLSAARNAGLAVARGDIIAFLDDDCTVSGSWLRDVASVFERCRPAGLVFGHVDAADHDPTMFIPINHIRVEKTLHRRDWPELWLRGFHVMGASMYFSRQVYERIGDFDEQLGSGARFPSGEDVDYAYRTLLNGSVVVLTPAIKVTHHGARPFAGGGVSRLIRDGLRGAAATQMKLLKSGQGFAVLLMASSSVRFLGRIKPGRLLTVRRGSGATWVLYFWDGLLSSRGVQAGPPTSRRFASGKSVDVG